MKIIYPKIIFLTLHLTKLIFQILLLIYILLIFSLQLGRVVDVLLPQVDFFTSSCQINIQTCIKKHENRHLLSIIPF